MRKVHILGSGGREHAIGWAFRRCGFEVHYYPGNAGTSKGGVNHSYDGLETVKRIEEGLVIPGSEKYLVDGVANVSEMVFGPKAEVARLEGSKVFAKEFMRRHGIRTARFEVVHSPEELPDKLRNFSPPYVLKADGLAGGKGVLILEDVNEAIEKGSKLMSGELLKGVKGPLVIDEFLKGEELSAMALINGSDFVLLPFVRDYKKLRDGDGGPNTGGMGSWGPVEVPAKTVEAIEELVHRTLWALDREGYTYRGFLYLGLMLVDGEPFILEYNVRLGDPETEVVVLLDPERFVDNILKAFEGSKMGEFNPRGYAVDVVLASEGYPDSPRKGQEITMPEEGLYFFAGVSQVNGKLVVSGGRVIHSMGAGKTKDEARKNAYLNAEKVEFPGKYYRRDIAL